MVGLDQYWVEGSPGNPKCRSVLLIFTTILFVAFRIGVRHFVVVLGFSRGLHYREGLVCTAVRVEGWIGHFFTGVMLVALVCLGLLVSIIVVRGLFCLC